MPPPHKKENGGKNRFFFEEQVSLTSFVCMDSQEKTVACEDL